MKEYEVYEIIDGVIGDCVSLIKTKSSDYGGIHKDQDNCILGQVFRIQEKAARIVNICKKNKAFEFDEIEEVNHESFEDNVKDLINHCLLLMVKIEKTKREKR